jgi:hypothetical protein
MDNRHINTFIEGMDKSNAPSKVKNTTYYHAEELSLVTYTGLNFGTFINQAGNSLLFRLPENYSFHGYGNIRDRAVILARHVTGNDDRVYVLDFEGDRIVNLDTNLYPQELVYEGDLNFDILHPIRKVIGRYETETVQKIYFTDFYNNVRFMNVEDPDLSTYTADRFEFVPFIDFNSVELLSIGQGALPTSTVQYSYQLYNLNGAESIISPAGELINLYTDPLSETTTINVEGSQQGTSSGKSVTIKLDAIDPRFDRIRLIRLTYEDINTDPKVDIVTEQVVGADFTYTDYGNTLETIPFTFYRELTNLFKAQDLETKNNYLFAAGIQESYFEFDYDARAYRFRSSVHGSGLSQVGTVYDADGTNGRNIDKLESDWNVPEEHDAFNIHNNLSGDTFNPNFLHIYQSDGVTIGGEGINIKYRFSIKEILIDETTGARSSQQHYVGLEGSSENPSYASYASPYQRAKALGYQRDEIYPFAIVGFDERGRPSFAKWIGDIRFPRIGDVLNLEEEQITEFSASSIDEGYDYGLMIYNIISSSETPGGEFRYGALTTGSTTVEDVMLAIRSAINASVHYECSAPTFSSPNWTMIIKRKSSVAKSKFRVEQHRYDTVPPAPPAPAPTGVTAVQESECEPMSVSWNSVANATFYKVYRSTNGSLYEYYDSSLSTGYLDYFCSHLITYYYIVEACNSSGCSAQSSSSAGVQYECTGGGELPE